MDATLAAANHTCERHDACAECDYCDDAVKRCTPRPCFDVPPGHCGCPHVPAETLVAIGAVVLCLLLLLLSLTLCHSRRCGGRSSSTSTTATESLLGSVADPGGMSGVGRGRTSIDSTISCIVCMDASINCVLMPCAHEVACARCASRLRLCPVCRMPVEATMKVRVATLDEIAQVTADCRALERASSASDMEPTLPPMSPGSRSSPTPDAPSPQGDASAAAGELEPSADVESVAVPPTAGTHGVPKDAAKGQGAPPMRCLRCAAEPPNCVFLPCSHKVWCVQCAALLPANCPICNTGITQSLRTFHKRL